MRSVASMSSVAHCSNQNSYVAKLGSPARESVEWSDLSRLGTHKNRTEALGVSTGSEAREFVE